MGVCKLNMDQDLEEIAGRHLRAWEQAEAEQHGRLEFFERLEAELALERTLQANEKDYVERDNERLLQELAALREELAAARNEITVQSTRCEEELNLRKLAEVELHSCKAQIRAFRQQTDEDAGLLEGHYAEKIMELEADLAAERNAHAELRTRFEDEVSKSQELQKQLHHLQTISAPKKPPIAEMHYQRLIADLQADVNILQQDLVEMTAKCKAEESKALLAILPNRM
ncbi:hypothetical protein HDU86_008150 [Geranomyces michiganensis]|nr:hypothetical protein HDU86_008150 [Geranomyces michiganensis]